MNAKASRDLIGAPNSALVQLEDLEPRIAIHDVDQPAIVDLTQKLVKKIMHVGPYCEIRSDHLMVQLTFIYIDYYLFCFSFSVFSLTLFFTK